MRTRRRWGLGLGLLAVLGAWSGPASAEDAPPPPPVLAPMEVLFLPIKQQVEKLPPFLGDTELNALFRSYYFNRTKPDGSENEAWAFGGWISYQSGWLADTFAMGASLYGSAPLYAPNDKDGTLLLQPGQRGYYVPGQGWGALRYRDLALVKGFRQLVDQTYINPQDNRMTPNTFQGVTLGGKLGWAEYLGGFLWKIKPRNADEFVSMSEQAGAPDGSDDGVGLVGVRLLPFEGLRIDLSNQLGVNTFNTVYAAGEYLQPLSKDWKLRLGLQFTDQRAVGDALLPAAGGTSHWGTQTGGARLQALSGDLTLTTAFSITGSGNNIQSPYGSFPGYLSLIELDFNRAREKALLVGAAYDFEALVRGLYANCNLAWGRDAIVPSTGAKAPNRSEYDLTVDYRPPFKGILVQGLWFRARAAIVDEQHADRLGYQFRIILNWNRDLI